MYQIRAERRKKWYGERGEKSDAKEREKDRDRHRHRKGGREREK